MRPLPTKAIVDSVYNLRDSALVAGAILVNGFQATLATLSPAQRQLLAQVTPDWWRGERGLSTRQKQALRVILIQVRTEVLARSRPANTNAAELRHEQQ